MDTHSLPHVRRTLHNADDVVALGEESVPVLQCLFLLVIQILPLRLDVLCLR